MNSRSDKQPATLIVVKRLRTGIGKLEVVAFASGFALMAYELAGARILAPGIGSSMYVWTSVIGVIIAALSLGYWVGGKVADRRGYAIDVARFLLLIAVAVVGTMVSYEAVMPWVTIMFADARIQGVVTSLLLFAPASFLLGVVSPYLAKLKVRSLKMTGRSIAGLSTFNALGSITGTFITGFILFSYIGSRETLVIIAVSVMAISWLMAPRVQVWQRIGLSVAVLLPAGLSLLTPNAHSISIDTPTAHYEIVERDGVRMLLTGPRGVQSGVNMSNSDELVYWYTQKMAEVVEYAPERDRILMLGGGVFTVPRYLAHKYPDTTIDVVEIDPQLAEIARRHFHYDDPPNVNLVFQDARTYINQTHKRYDVVLVDVYGDIEVPFTFMTREYGQSLARIVKPTGIVASNLMAGFKGQCRQLLEALDAPYRAHFGYVQYKSEDTEDEKHMNIVATYSRQSIQWPQSKQLKLSGSPLYTDNFAPSERLQYGCLHGA